MNQRWTALALAALVAPLAACGSSSEPAQKGPVTITFANADPAATWQPVIDHCQTKHPDIKVKQLNIPYQQLTSTVTQRLSQGGADLDVLNLVPAWIRDYANRGFLADLSDLRADAEKVAVSKDMVENNVIDGKLLAISPWTTSQYLYYNAAALKKAGITPPSMDPEKRWTWQQVRAAAEKLKAGGAVQYPIMFDQFDSYYQLQPLGVSAGGGNGLSGDKQDTPDFENAGWQQALSFYGGLFKEGLAPRGITSDKSNALFAAGKAGLMVSGPWTVPNAVKAKLPFGVAAAPVFEGGKPVTATDSWTMGVSAKSKHLEAAKTFLRCVNLTPEGNTKSIQVAQITPTHKDSYQAFMQQFEKQGGPATAGLTKLTEHELQNTAVHRPSAAGYTVFEGEAEKMFADIRNGADPAERARRADQKIAEQFKRLG